MKISAGYHSSIFRDFESHLRTENDFVEDDIWLVLDDIISSFTTKELQPGIYTFKDLSGALFCILQPEYPASSSEIVNEFDDITLKIKLVVRSGNIGISLMENCFLALF